MAYTYFRAVTDDGGAKGTETTSGTTNNLFNLLTTQERLNGVVKQRKIYLQSDVDASVYIGILTPGDYPAGTALFNSLSDGEVVGDLPNAEPYFGAAKINEVTSNTEIEVTGTDNTLFRVGDYCAFKNAVVEIITIGANGDDVVLIFASDLNAPAVGEYITSLLPASLTAGVAKPIWRENGYPSGAAKLQENNTVEILIVD